MEIYEIEIEYFRSSPLESQYPKTNLKFPSKIECYSYFNTYKKIDSNYLFICIYYNKEKYRVLIERYDNKPERFSEDVWRDFLDKKGYKSGLSCIIGSSVIHHNVNDTKIIKILCKIPNLRKCFIKNKSKSIILDNTGKYDEILRIIES